MSGGLPSRHDLGSGNQGSFGNLPSHHDVPAGNNHSVEEAASPVDSVGSAPPAILNLPPVSFDPPDDDDAAVGSEDPDEPPYQPPPTVGRNYSAGVDAVKFEVVGRTLQPSRILANICREHCFTQHIEKGAFKWTMMSQRTKNKYWGEFLKYAKWVDTHPQTIYKLWEQKTRACYRDYVGKDLRKHSKPGLPRGCGQAAYDSFKAYWETPEFKKESEQNRGNRTNGGNSSDSTYHGGCKGTWQWAIDLAKENKPSDPHSVMKHCYTKKHDGKTFSNKRAKKIDTRYVVELEKATQSQSQTDTGSSSEFVEKNLYKQIALEEGGVGHGRIFGTGSAATIIYGDVNVFGPPQQTTPPDYVLQLKKMQEETAALKKSFEDALQLHSQQLSFMSQFLPQTQPPPQMQAMNFTQMLGSQTNQFPYFQGAAGAPLVYGQAAAAPFYSQPFAAPQMYSQAAPAQAAPAAAAVPLVFQAPSSVAPMTTPSWANNCGSAAVEDLAGEYAAS